MDKLTGNSREQNADGDQERYHQCEEDQQPNRVGSPTEHQ